MANLKRAAIIFDFDDTLVYSHEQFLLAEQTFITRLCELDLYDDGLLAMMRENDIANVQRAGYLAAVCFPQSFVQTYESYCAIYGRTADEQEKSQLMEMGWRPYLDPPRAIEGARELLNHLRVNAGDAWRLILYTQGEQEIQQQRLNLSGMADMFDAIKIVKKKNDAELQALLEEQQLEPSLSWYVGNSLRSDINPAIRAGLNAAHLTLANCWSYEDEEPCGFYHIISNLGQFMDLLETC